MNNNPSQPIGIFDSGIGGTSIFKEVHSLLPHEDIIYLADSKNAPYGYKSKEEITALCKKNTELLLAQNCKLIIVACNTATTNAIETLRETYSIPFIGIEPAIKPAALMSKNKAIGILATKGTLSSELFAKTSEIFAKNTAIVEVIGAGLVEAIEAGEIENTSTKKLVRQLVQPMLDKNIDYLVLGCSHYPYLIPLLKQILPKYIVIIDSGKAVAKQTKFILHSLGLLEKDQKKASIRFYTNRSENILKKFVPEFKVSYLDF
ncbi:glutamate racemase [Mesonia aestuariivivens]|uniref:Glutamate racemase n=1 Tax=Mesonia aestuariivivens TaxID=2796128 RepID=A0ABS6W3I3_9FLAO|nr:glutamate racemase [Mesonia aestuariivivens]MBW2962420.1 glutamate racemase [Mesonia aestuariivivens]